MRNNKKYFIDTNKLPKKDELNCIYINFARKLVERDYKHIPFIFLEKAKEVCAKYHHNMVKQITYIDEQRNYIVLEN